MFWGTVYKIFMLCVFRCTDTIVVRLIKSRRREVKNSWSGKNGCHLSSENVNQM